MGIQTVALQEKLQYDPSEFQPHDGDTDAQVDMVARQCMHLTHYPGDPGGLYRTRDM